MFTITVRLMSSAVRERGAFLRGKAVLRGKTGLSCEWHSGSVSLIRGTPQVCELTLVILDIRLGLASRSGAPDPTPMAARAAFFPLPSFLR